MAAPGRRLRVIGGSLVVLAACMAPQEPGSDQRVGGEYPLAAYNAVSVPGDLAELPTRDRQPSGCWLRIVEGRITLQANRQFEYRYHFINSCTGDVLGQVQVQGTWTLSGRRIEFTTIGSRFEGEVAGDTLRVVRDPEVLTFVR